MVKVGIGTKLGLVFSVLALVPPAAKEIIALVENTQAHWNQADKTSLIAGAIIAAVTIVQRAAQAAIVLWKGGSA